MRFRLGPVPDDVVLDDSWRPIREPGPVGMQFIAYPLGFVAAAGVAYVWYRLSGATSPHFQTHHPILFLAALILSFPTLIVVHEFLHAVVYPDFGMSSATIIGAWPTRLLFYAAYTGPMSRNRFLAVFAAPTLVITVLPLVLAACGGLPGSWWLWVMWFSVWNAFCACGDYIGFCLILFQVPRAALVQNKGWRTYWKRV